MRSYLVYAFLLAVRLVSRFFWTFDMQWVGSVPKNPWRNIRLVCFLNHTSLYEPIFVGGVPSRFLWRIARHGVVPAAEKTMSRPLVGKFFGFVAHQVVSISRERDHTWYDVLSRIDPDSMVVILPEGRMKRANGLDSQGNPMTVRGGVADIIETIGSGRMLVAYSLGLHHVQVPGQKIPHLFKKVSMRLEIVDIAEYRKQFASTDYLELKRAIRDDLERRRDIYCV